MIEAFKQWLLGVIACALLVSLAEQISPEGAVRKIARFTGALLLLLAMLRPFASPELPDEAWNAGGYREAVARLELELAGVSESTLADGIAEELAAYIEDKAGSLGTDVRAEVTVECVNGVPTPQRVALHGAYSEALAEAIASELGIAKEKQEWIENK